ncbi:MAG: methyltransferase domain-containing protein [Patescibacteria group bacterium]
MFAYPQQCVAELDLTEGMRVADFGAGSGFFAKAAAARVGHTGKVYAIEVQKGLVKKLESEIAKEGISNMECIWGDVEKLHGRKLADKSMDAVIISNVLFQAEDKIGLIDEARRIIAKNGKILLVDFYGSSSVAGPRGRDAVSAEKARELFERRGFRISETISPSDHQYGIIFTHESR